jgi:hypothetical protein
MPRFLITFTPNTKTIESIVEAKDEDDAIFKWENDEVLYRDVIEHGDEFLSVDLDE